MELRSGGKLDLYSVILERKRKVSENSQRLKFKMPAPYVLSLTWCLPMKKMYLQNGNRALCSLALL